MVVWLLGALSGAVKTIHTKPREKSTVMKHDLVMIVCAIEAIVT